MMCCVQKQNNFYANVFSKSTICNLDSLNNLCHALVG